MHKAVIDKEVQRTLEENQANKVFKASLRHPMAWFRG
jgi:hypothetical protein